MIEVSTMQEIIALRFALFEENCDGKDEKMEAEEIVKRPAGFMERMFLKKACKVSKESRYS